MLAAGMNCMDYENQAPGYAGAWLNTDRADHIIFDQPEHAAAGNPGGRRRRRTARRYDKVKVSGPCYCKVLVPNHIAGFIIGKGGSTIASIELLTRCQLQVSAFDQFFPGTNDRIVIMGGTMASLKDCITFLLQRIYELTSRKDGPERSLLLKLVVPNSSVSALIGHGGCVARELSNETGCRVNISPRVGDLKERLVMLSGSHGCVAEAALHVCSIVQRDPHFEEHLLLKYEVQMPLGVWAGNKSAPTDPSAPVLSPASAQRLTKRELIEHLRKTAPREILMKHGLLGNINNTVKSKSSQDLTTVVSETWLARGGDPAHMWTESHPPPTELTLMLHDSDLIRARAMGSYTVNAHLDTHLDACSSTQLAGSSASNFESEGAGDAPGELSPALSDSEPEPKAEGLPIRRGMSDDLLNRMYNEFLGWSPQGELVSSRPSLLVSPAASSASTSSDSHSETPVRVQGLACQAAQDELEAREGLGRPHQCPDVEESVDALQQDSSAMSRLAPKLLNEVEHFVRILGSQSYFRF